MASSTERRPTLVFDGACGFCTSSAHWIDRRVRSPVEVVPWQRADLPALGLSRADVDTAAYWVDDHGNTFRGHLAVGHALMSCGQPWRGFGWLCVHAPTSWVAAAVYRLVARVRHRLPGGTPACRLS